MQLFNNLRNKYWVRRSLIKCRDQVSSRSWNDHNSAKLCSINLKFWEITWIIWPNVFRNFGVPSSKCSQYMAKIVKKKEWRNQWNFGKLSEIPSLTHIYILWSFCEILRRIALLKGCVWVITFGPPHKNTLGTINLVYHKFSQTFD